MKKIRYLCLDDEQGLVKKLLRRIEEQCPNLSIQVRAPKPFEEELAGLEDDHRKAQLDGLILDLRLDETAAEGVKPVRYTATGLAAQLRSWLATRKQEVTGFPIVLWSVERRMEYAFKTDASNKDLFDLILEKEQFPKEAACAAEQLVGLVDGYRRISSSLGKARTFLDVLRPNRSVAIDERIGLQFAPAFKSHPTHRYAQFIFTQLIERSGPLIDEPILCARLGVDIACSGKQRLLSKTPTASRYRGPFDKPWSRWWTSVIDAWVRKLNDNQSLAQLSAVERVTLLRKALKIDGLKPAEPFAKEYSTYFSTICVHTNKPLDPIDGFVLAEIQPQPWQARRYVARDVALDPARYNFKGKIDPIDVERLSALRVKLREHGNKSGKTTGPRN